MTHTILTLNFIHIKAGKYMYRKYRQIRQNIIYFKLYTNISKIPIAKINRNALIHTSSRAHIIRRVKLLNQVKKFNRQSKCSYTFEPQD